MGMESVFVKCNQQANARAEMRLRISYCVKDVSGRIQQEGKVHVALRQEVASQAVGDLAGIAL